MRTNAPQFRGLLNWLITTLLDQTLLSPSLQTLDLTPLDPPNQIGKYQRRPNAAKEGFFLYMIDATQKDPSGNAALDPNISCKQKWEERKRPFPAEFFPSFRDISEKLTPASMHRVYSFGDLNLGGPTRGHVRHRLQMIYDALQDKGLFIGWVLDTGALWNAAHKRFADMSKVARISVQHEEWDETMQRMVVLERDMHLLDDPPYFGLRARISINGEAQTFWNGYSVHMGSFIELCEEIGFDIVTIEGLEDYYQQNFAAFYHHLIAYQIVKEKNHTIAPPDLELAKLLSVFVLQKSEKSRQVSETQHSVMETSMYHDESGVGGEAEGMDESEW